MKFKDYNIHPEIKRALDDMGIHTPTDIQEKAIPEILKGEATHILAQAKTGTGKTLAFSIPVVEFLDPSLRSVQVVILVPTRELCKQVYQVISKLSKYRNLKAVEVYGGVSINRQIEKIKAGAQMVVATPGRLIDLFKRNAIIFNNVKFAILDEADRMLDMGFLPDVDFILFEAMKNVYPRLLLFSATMLPEVKDIMMDYSLDEHIVEIDVSRDDLTVSSCKQYYYLIDDPKKKYNSFIKLLQREKPSSFIVFVNTKRWADSLKRKMIKDKRINFKVGLLQGDMSQRQREIAMSDFRKKKITCLIATDVAARGLDIPHVSHIINYDLPVGNPEDYVHRIGRTSRMERAGIAISLVDNEEMNMIRRIELFMKKDIKRFYLTREEREQDKQKYRKYPTVKETKKRLDELEDEDFPETIADTSIYG
ncbi:DEAD/DEAH box helicase [Candidatus Heimdallarchaeota archaeon]|nr:MAG: DEAD/DEAH box helicase [Candidatus Heimdallarchaeota archaeon]